MSNSKHNLPRHIAMMVEKGNLVAAIKNLADDEGISMDEAKTRIDLYEESLKQQQQKKQKGISDKQQKKKGYAVKLASCFVLVAASMAAIVLNL